MESTFVHSPLEGSRTIRLLQLEPAQEHMPLQGSILHVDLDDRSLGYAALSYVWGVPVLSRKLHLGNRVIWITENLDLALRSFRKFAQGEPFKIWADAVCIDQSNVVERNNQVLLMKSIYKNAKLVLVHLDSAYEGGSHHFSAIMNRIWRVIVRLKEDRIMAQKIRHTVSASSLKELYEELDLPDYNSTDWKLITSLSKQSWWSRCWTLQEARILTDTIFFCADWDEAISGSQFVSFFLGAMKHNLPVFTYEDKCCRRLFGMQLREGTAKPDSLIRIMSRNRGNGASDARDTMYAYLGLSTEADLPVVAPDYSEPFEQTVLRYSRYFANNGDGLVMLYQCFPLQLAWNLPSWAPNWPEGPRGLEKFLLSSGRASLSDVRLVDSGMTVAVRGTTMGVVKRVGRCRMTEDLNIPNFQQIYEHFIDWAAEMEDFCRFGFTNSPYSDPVNNLKWRVLYMLLKNEAHSEEMRTHFANSSCDFVNDPSFYSFFAKFLPYAILKKEDDDPNYDETLPEHFDWCMEAITSQEQVNRLFHKSSCLVHQILSRLQDAKICLSSHGHLGFADLTAEFGDVLFLPQGGPAMLILRPVEISNAGQMTYRLMGQAIMYGFENEPDPQRTHGDVVHIV